MGASAEKRIKAILSTEGISDFNKGFKNVNNELKLVKSELNLASQGIKSFGKDNEKLKNIQQSLAKQTELHAKKVNMYKQAIEKTSKKLDDNIKARDRLKKSLDEANTKYKEAVKIYGKESEEAKKTKEEVDKLTIEYKKKEKAVESNAKSIRTYETNMNKANAQMVKCQGELKKINEELVSGKNKWEAHSEKLKKHSERLKHVGEVTSGLGDKILKVHAPLMMFGAGALKVSSDYESAMSNVQAISGVTGDDFIKLSEKAKELGAKTSKSAKESADAMSYQALAGWNVNQILEATEPILRLSEAGNMDLARASDAVTDSMSALGIQTKDLTNYLDICAQSQRKSNTTAEMMLDAYIGCGGTLKNLKVPLTESATLIGVLANRGIKGSEAGTSLNSVLINLTSGAGQAGVAMEKLGLKAFDSKGRFKGVKNVLNELNKKLSKCTEEERNMYLAMIGGKTQIDTLNALLSGTSEEFNDLEKDIKHSNGALTEMATVMQDNLKGDIVKLKSQLEGVGIQLGKVLIPVAKDFVATLSKWTDAFSKLSPEAQRNIIKMAGFGIATGGALKILGSGISTIGSLAGGLSKLTGILGKASKGAKIAEGATKGLSLGTKALGLASKAGTALLNPYTLAIAGVGLAGYATYKHLKKEVVPAVDLFTDKVEHSTKKIKQANGEMATEVVKTTTKISEGTKKAVGSYVDLDKKSYEALMNLYVHTDVITKENSKKLVENYSAMNNKIKQGMDKNHNERIKNLQEFLKNSSGISKEEQKQMLDDENKYHDFKKKLQNEHCDRILKILEKAKNEKRVLTNEEMKEINNIQNTMKENAVKHLSEEEVESKVILERLKASNERLTTETASKAIENAEKQRKQSVKKAEKQYNDTVKNIIRMRDETGTITKEQADKMIENAEQQKKQSIDKAEILKKGVLEQIRRMNSDALQDINTTDGSIKTKWDKLKEFFSSNPIMRTIRTVTENSQKQLEGTGHNWTGTNNWRGGLTTLHERGYELYDLPKSTRVYNHEASEELVKQTAENVATKVANSVLKNFNGLDNNKTQTIIIPVQLDGREIARVTAKPMSQELSRLNKRGGLGYA